MQPLSSDCLIASGKPNNKGYKCTYFLGRRMVAHRAAYIAAHGEIPPGLDVCHRCDNRACVNPAHLFLGTRKENMADCIAKGRMPRGEQRAHAKLTAETVMEIKRRLAGGPRGTAAALAREFGVGHRTIGKIKNGEKWSHVAA